jgi:hypothetical protein
MYPEFGERSMITKRVRKRPRVTTAEKRNSAGRSAFDYQMQVVETNGTITGSAPFIITGNGERLFVLLTSLPAIYIYEPVSIP